MTSAGKILVTARRRTWAGSRRAGAGVADSFVYGLKAVCKGFRQAGKGGSCIPMIVDRRLSRGQDAGILVDWNRQVLGCAPVAQLDRAFASGAKGQWFESTRVYQIKPLIPNNFP